MTAGCLLCFFSCLRHPTKTTSYIAPTPTRHPAILSTSRTGAAIIARQRERKRRSNKKKKNKGGGEKRSSANARRHHHIVFILSSLISQPVQPQISVYSKFPDCHLISITASSCVPRHLLSSNLTSAIHQPPAYRQVPETTAEHRLDARDPAVPHSVSRRSFQFIFLLALHRLESKALWVYPTLGFRDFQEPPTVLLPLCLSDASSTALPLELHFRGRVQAASCSGESRLVRESSCLFKSAHRLISPALRKSC